jgi:hypothetical protein
MQWIIDSCWHRLEISSLSALWIGKTYLTGSFPQEVQSSMSALAVGEFKFSDFDEIPVLSRDRRCVIT